MTTAGSNWVFRFTSPDGRRREMGLGPALRSTLAASGESVALARRGAALARDLIAQGIDPLEQRKAARDAAQAKTAASKATTKTEATTLARVARRYHEAIVVPQRTPLHAAHWINSLENHVPASLWHAPIDSIKAPALLAALAPVRRQVPETCDRVRQRLEVIFDDAIFHGMCTINPATVIRRKLAELPRGTVKGNFKALPFADVPAFVRTLSEQSGTSAKALEFSLLTAARTAEVLGCQWEEIDAQAGVWRVPAARMKGGEEHVVHLSVRALEIVETMRELQGEPWVFPSPMDRQKPLSNMAMLTLLRRMDAQHETTVHGLCRSSFSSWANEHGVARPDVIEAALAHKESDKVRAAYNRASFAVERRNLLTAWANYC
ncbi:MAG: tyrosine-type recombinase/integrase, partial [Pseudorhodobacter sp.]|nr:tyrosine-type recombinase/integrase [Rhizobacter sp.]